MYARARSRSVSASSVKSSSAEISPRSPQRRAGRGELADGTVLWVADERAVGEHVVPAITKSAEAAGRSAPRVVAGIPVCVCAPHEVDAARILGEAEVSIHLAGHEPTYGPPRHASGNTATSPERLQPEAEFGQGPRLQRSGDPLREEPHSATRVMPPFEVP